MFLHYQELMNQKILPTKLSTPINGFLNFGGIKTLTLNKAKIATKNAGPKTHGRGSNK